MEQWDQDFVDLVTTGHVTIRKDGTGGFQFGAVQGEREADGRAPLLPPWRRLGFHCKEDQMNCEQRGAW